MTTASFELYILKLISFGALECTLKLSEMAKEFFFNPVLVVIQHT